MGKNRAITENIFTKISCLGEEKMQQKQPKSNKERPRPELIYLTDEVEVISEPYNGMTGLVMAINRDRLTALVNGEWISLDRLRRIKK